MTDYAGRPKHFLMYELPALKWLFEIHSMNWLWSEIFLHENIFNPKLTIGHMDN